MKTFTKGWEKHTYPPSNGQQDSRVLRESHGRDTFSDNEWTSNTALAVVPGAESVPVSRVPARCRQLHCRPGVQENPIISRVETEGGGV